jgi:glycosyltransferase involved in cell wall biosynthesis
MAKILLGISDSFCANFIAGQPSYFATMGYDIVVLSAPGAEISLLTKEEHCKLYTFPFTKSITPFADLGTLFKIIKILKAEKPDVINAGNPKSGLLLMLAAFILGIKGRIFTMHGLPSDAKKGFLKLLLTALEKFTCSIANKVIIVSPSLKQHALARKIVKESKCIVLLPASCNGLNMADFAKTPLLEQEITTLQKKYQLLPNNFVIGYAGRINYDKGITILIDAFLNLADQNEDVRLLMVGPYEPTNPLPSKYIDAIYNHPKIIYIGKVNNMPNYYGCMDVLVLPSFREGFGYVLIEAAAMQIPVIAPNIPGCQDALLPNINGLVFEKGNTKQLVTHINTYLQNAELRQKHGKNGLDWVSKNFVQEKIWSQIHTIYKQFI